jgi:hypothetical protein
MDHIKGFAATDDVLRGKSVQSSYRLLMMGLVMTALTVTLSSCRSIYKDGRSPPSVSSGIVRPVSDLPTLLNRKEPLEGIGIVDANGQLVLPPKFGSIPSLSRHQQDSWPLPAQDIFAPTLYSGWGYVDRNGDWVVPPRYDHVEPYVNGFGRVHDGRQWRAVDAGGELLLGVTADELGETSEGLIPARIGDAWGAFSLSGDVAIPFEYDYVGSFRFGLAAAARDGKWGYIDTENQVVVPFDYGGTSEPLGPDHLVVFYGASLSVQTTSYDETIPPQTVVFIELVPELLPSMRYALINRDGEELWSPDALRALFPEIGAAQLLSPSSRGYPGSSRAVVVSGFGAVDDHYEQYSVIVDLAGRPLFDEVFSDVYVSEAGGYAVGRGFPVTIHVFDENLALTDTVSVSGLPPGGNSSGSNEATALGALRLFETAVEISYQSVDGQHTVLMIDTATGRPFLPPDAPRQFAGRWTQNVSHFDMVPSLYRFQSDYTRSLVEVQLSGRFGGDSLDVRARFERTIDPEEWDGFGSLGRYIIENRRTGARTSLTESIRFVGGFHDGVAAYRDGDEWGFINENGTAFIAARFANVSDMINGTAAAKSGEMWGIIDRHGSWIVSPIYHYAMPFMGSLAPVWNGDKWGYVDQTGRVKIDFMFDYAEPFRDGWAVVADGVESVGSSGSRGWDHPSFIVAGDWYLIRPDGSRLIGPTGDTIWRLFGDEVMIRDEDKIVVHRLSDGRSVELDAERAWEYREAVMYSPQRLIP